MFINKLFVTNYDRRPAGYPRNHGKFWSAREIQYLYNCCYNRTPKVIIASKLGRSMYSIECKMKELGL